MTEIKTVPPQLMMYALLGAGVLILICCHCVYFHVRSEDDDSTAAHVRPRLPLASIPLQPRLTASPSRGRVSC